jgi:predicted phage terminase large subunit-like protein
VQRNYFETMQTRLRAPNVPVILLGHRLHEDDLQAHLLSGADGQTWKTVVIKALDEAGNARYPEVYPKKQLLLMKEKQPYVFASQYQQDPIPAGGGLFKEDWFHLIDELPEIVATFVTADTAETEKEYNDATVFSFWGLYRVKFKGEVIDDLYALHWIDCRELRVEPKDLEDEFLDFWTSCMRFKVKPKFAAIEKKSTGVTLLSVLKKIQGLQTLEIERNKASGSKTDRFLELQPFIANRQVSLLSDGKHTKMCIEHMRKITANNTHRFDDIADTCYDAVKIALIDKVVVNVAVEPIDHESTAQDLMGGYHQLDRLRKVAYGTG